MSQRERSEQGYQSSRSPSRTEWRTAEGREELLRPQQTERQLHGDSPTRHDVQFYVRKVNRYEGEIQRLQHDLSVAKFKLSKAEDFQIKYEILFKDHQETKNECQDTNAHLEATRRELERVKEENRQKNIQINTLRSDVDSEKRNNQELHSKKEQLRSQTVNQGQEERESLKEAFNREIDNIKKDNRDLTEKLNREINELKGTVSMKQTIQESLVTKLQHIKKEKNSEISRLKELVTGLRNDLGETHNQNEDNSRRARELLINETEDRISNVRSLSSLIEQTLLQQINSLNDTLTKKNEQIRFLIACDKKQLEDHQNSENNLRTLIKKLQDKIFTIQRQNELELYGTIQRLKTQYNENLAKANDEWQDIRLAHSATVDSLKRKIDEQNKEINLLNSENRHLETRHKQLAQDQEQSVQMLSQKILLMEGERDDNLRNYTTSMKQIEDDAKSKLDDLHTAIQSKNTQFEILQAQIRLKNGEITHLLEEISRLRNTNREKVKKLETTNAAEQNALNNQISDLKKQILEFKRNLHQLENKCTDDEAAHQLDAELLKNDLQSQKEANALLNSRNAFLVEWCSELERDLKAERVANVNILHDQNISMRENVQIREEVRVEVEALKAKEVEQLKNVHKLEKNRLESELAKKEHELRDKKEELSRLLVQYKGLEAKVGKSSKVDRSAEDEGKCRATLEAEILLTQNVFNLINRP